MVFTIQYYDVLRCETKLNFVHADEISLPPFPFHILDVFSPNLNQVTDPTQCAQETTPTSDMANKLTMCSWYWY